MATPSRPSLTSSVSEPLAAAGRLARAFALTPAFLRRFVRSREIGLTFLAALVGVLAAGLVALMSAVALLAHRVLFGLEGDERLSGLTHVDPYFLVWPVLGGALLCAVNWVAVRVGRGELVDPIEANALHGGRMSVRDSALLALQTIISNGFGASVGLEAGYTQIASGLSSRIGGWMRLRREDLRIIVGCGAAAAIAAAFNGPFTGAFYAFELVLAQYAVGYVAPTMAAAISATLAMRAFGGAPFAISIVTARSVSAWDFPWFMLLGLACAILGIFWMRMLPELERLFAATRAPRIVHPIIGGIFVGGLGFISPQTLAGGHGALQLTLFTQLGLAAAVALAALKMVASAISLGSGFRGGLFFSSLLVGALAGRALALTISHLAPTVSVDPMAFALVGMGALAAAVIGAPLTMSFLVLETTSDYALTGAVLAAAVTSNLIVRELFGYSFSTWRFHLRGETIRSARDVGWARDLTVDRLMRTDPATARSDMTIAAFRLEFPLGARQKVALLDKEDRFDGLVSVVEAHAAGLDESLPVRTLGQTRDAVLLPRMSVKQAMVMFDETEADTLPVLADLEHRKLVGTLKETFATRRYAEEIEKAHGLGIT